MTTFDDGPARGQTLMLKRTPYYLRVVFGDGKWDALDQPSDSPRKGETVHVYRLCEMPSTVHVNAARGGGGFFNRASYQIVPERPTDAEMRDTVGWRRWCDAHKPADLEMAVKINGCLHEELDMEGVCKLCGLGGAPAKLDGNAIRADWPKPYKPNLDNLPGKIR